LSVKAPKYADAISSEVQKHAEVVYDRFMDSGFVEFDAFEPFKAGSGANKPKGQIELLGENIINPDPKATPIVRLTIKTKIPAESLP